MQLAVFLFIYFIEMHRTQSEFEDQLIIKVFVFQFVNFYSSIIYIAVFKGRWVYTVDILIHISVMFIWTIVTKKMCAISFHSNCEIP